MPRHPLHDLVAITTDPIFRKATCPECGAVFPMPRRGVAGGALAATARLLGSVAEHVRLRHPQSPTAAYLAGGPRPPLDSSR